MTMYQLLEQTAKKYPDNVFIVREGIKFKDFPELVKARATSLAALGVKQNDTVGILSHNIMEFPLTLFAIWYLGARALLLDTNLTPFEYDNMANLTDTKLIIAEKSFFYKTTGFKFYDIETKDSKTDPKLAPATIASKDIATLSFTSGSTGIPKIVPLTHFNLTECAASLQDMSDYIKPGDIVYGFLPMYHVFGFAVELLATLHYGAGTLLQPTVNPTEILEDFKKFQPQIIPAVPRVFEIFRNKIIDGMKKKKIWWLARFILRFGSFFKKIGLGGLVRKIQDPVLAVFGGKATLLIAGGASTKPEVENFYLRLGLAFIQGYGLTETVGPICISKPEKYRLPYSVGAPIINNECEVRDKDEEGIGILWMRGRQVFDGYLNNPEANAEVFDERGFFNTGDMVSMDKNGEIHFHSRKKQIIVLDSGKNVYPDELEAMYLEIPGVKNVAVFEHTVKNKTVSYGVFQIEPGMTLNRLANAITEKNKKIASYKWVIHFAITTNDLPLTSTQKIKHHVVRERLINGEYPEKKEI
ncbi:MAG: AMP-binding protein [Alphaproteobacteria bacterium]|nr:AMP-binding protein [Alphaproteobacteria bacterium]